MPEFDLSKATYRDLRHLFATGDTKRDQGFVPREDVMRWTDQDYALDGCPEHALDIYYPKGTTQKLPVILNIHGGGWTYGNKGVYQYYCLELAAKGFTVVNMNYRLAPESRFPAQLEDICIALSWLKTEADRFYADMDHLFLIGDSAGAQLASHICVLMTNPSFAEKYELLIPDLKVTACALSCGVYDVKKSFFTPEGERISRAGDYLPGDQSDEELKDKLDVLSYVTADFPPTLLMGSVNDPISLTDTDAFYALLTEKGVSARSEWFGQDNPSLGHVFHINIALDEAMQYNQMQADFFRSFC